MSHKKQPNSKNCKKKSQDNLRDEAWLFSLKLIIQRPLSTLGVHKVCHLIVTKPLKAKSQSK